MVKSKIGHENKNVRIVKTNNQTLLNRHVNKD